MKPDIISKKRISAQDHKALALWAADCAEQVLPYFEKECPKDDRPRRAIKALRAWVRTGVFRMADVRKASLDAHAAAREAEEDSAARFAARAAGQAMATAHAPGHAIAAAYYAAKAEEAAGYDKAGKAVILASSSPRRILLLSRAGVNFRVVPHRTGEGVCAKLPPRELVELLAERKAEDVARRVKAGIVIGADTLLVCRGEKLGKPKSGRQAFEMLKRMSGRKVAVYSGVAVVDAETGRKFVGSEKSVMVMRRLPDSEIRAYIRTGEPLGKAGAIALQGRGAKLVSRVEGSRSNVIGLPLGCLRKGLARFGVKANVVKGCG